MTNMHSFTGDSMQDLAFFTIVKDDPDFLRIWIGHYSQVCPDLYVLDHGTGMDQRELRGLGVNVIPVHHDTLFDMAWLRVTVQNFQRFLLQSYETVVFGDVDELVVPSSGNDWRSILDSMDRWKATVLRPTGYEIVQADDEWSVLKGADSRALGLLTRRKYWRRHRLYDKPVVVRRPVEYLYGFHDAIPSDGASLLAPCSDLLLLHLHRIDRKAAEERHLRRKRLTWDFAALQSGHAYQNQLTGAAFNDWYDDDPNLGPPEPIPELIRAEF